MGEDPDSSPGIEVTLVWIDERVRFTAENNNSPTFTNVTMLYDTVQWLFFCHVFSNCVQVIKNKTTFCSVSHFSLSRVLKL